MPYASSVILKARLPFVALVALSRKTRVAAGASSSVRLSKVAARVGSGCPSFGGQRTAASARTRESMQLCRSVLLPQGKCQASSRLHARQPWGSGFFSQYQPTGSAQASFVQLVSGVGMLRHPNTK